jgi:hypothetical protein
MKNKKQLRTLIKVKLKKGSMKKLLYFAITLFLGTSCSDGGRGEVIGASGRGLWYHPDPYGMLYIPAGGYTMGQSDQDVPFVQYSRSKTVSIQAFYIDQTEISNNEYRQFVYWVRDSIARRILGEEAPDEFLTVTLDDELEEKDQEDWTLNWQGRLYWDDEEYSPLLAVMFLPESESFYD